MGVLPFGQHASPEGHVAEIPSGSERIRIPRVAPDMSDAVTGPAFDPAARIARPSLLGLRVIAQFDIPPLPHAVGTPVEPGIVLAAQACPIRIKGCVLPDSVRVDEIGMLERRPQNRRAALPEIAFQRLYRRYKFAVVYAGFGQVDLPIQRASGIRTLTPGSWHRPPQSNRVHNTASQTDAAGRCSGRRPPPELRRAPRRQEKSVAVSGAAVGCPREGIHRRFCHRTMEMAP